MNEVRCVFPNKDRPTVIAIERERDRDRERGNKAKTCRKFKMYERNEMRKRNENLRPFKHLYINVYGSIIHNRKNVETIQMSIA